jgi:DNA-binding LytR/AlgR family response regulator
VRSPIAVIAEDEPLLRAEIRDTLLALWPELHVGAEVGDGIEALAALERLGPDIMFLDIQMPGASGIDVARTASGRAHVVFISAFDAYAVSAFEQGAFDYILKPVSVDRVRLTVERLRRRLREVPADLSGLVDQLKSSLRPESRFLQWLTVPVGHELRVLAVADIAYLCADSKYTTVATQSSEFLLYSSLKEMRAKLDPAQFWQVHRSYIVNLSAIETMYRSFRGKLEIKLKGRKELLPVSTSYAHLFRPT